MLVPFIAAYDHHAASSHREIWTIGLKVTVFCGEQGEVISENMSYTWAAHMSR